MGLNDILTNKNINTANIIIYNGCTGSFLDNISRGSIVKGLTLKGFKRDFSSLEAILKYINTKNRYDNTNTQIYICGVPNFLGINISEIINKNLKKIANKFPNAIYIEPVKSKLFYHELNLNEIENNEVKNLKKKIKDMLLKIDIHYDEMEYLKLNTKIISSIQDNYILIDSLIKLDRFFYKFNQELEKKEELLTNTEIQNNLDNILIQITNNLSTNKLKKEFLNMAKKYLMSRYSHDFYYLRKSNISNLINRINIIQKR